MICGNGNGDEDNTKVQKGTFYIVVKELMKANNLSDITVTGHTIAVRQPSGTSGTHGFDIKEEHQWKFILKDKEVNTNTPGNAARMLLDPKFKTSLHPAFTWMWRFGFDKVHGKLTAKKVFLTCASDVALSSGKPIKVTRQAD